MLDIFVVLALGALWIVRWARKRGVLSGFLGSKLTTASESERIDEDLSDDRVSYPARAPISVGVIYTRPEGGEEGGGSSCSEMAAFLLHCCRVGVRKVVVQCSMDGVDEQRDRLEGVLAEYGRDSIHVDTHSAFGGSSCRGKGAATATDKSATRVLLLPPYCGRRTMVQVARELCHSPSPITTSTVAERLRESMMDDVQAVIMVGGAPTIAAFPPWPLRIAELIPVARLPRSKADFARAIGAFAGRDIRAGK